MPSESVNLLNVHGKNDSKSKSLKTAKVDNKNTEKQPTILTSDLNGHNGLDAAATNGFEFFTRLAYCQALLYKSWVETADELASNVAKSANPSNNNSKELTSLYIDAFEEKFTDLFRSPEFASNLGKLLNCLMVCIKEKDDISEIFLNNPLPKISKSSETGKGSRNGMKHR